uniref:Uncharacterized protein n=1 Tax=Rhizophora mucronata TaxID=61149 RepID=A0A2P2M791_RHIMU
MMTSKVMTKASSPQLSTSSSSSSSSPYALFLV